MSEGREQKLSKIETFKAVKTSGFCFYFVYGIAFVCLFFLRSSLCSPVWPRTFNVAQVPFNPA